jgi:hypothetical protein
MITPMSGEPSYPNFAGKHAEVRGLNVASAFVISDSLADLAWNPQFHGPKVEAGLITLYQAALTALRPSRVTPG